jgi:Icc-related predicted phosphoesterase
VEVAGLGGTFAPTWYETAAADLPHPKKGSVKATELADKRRHFVREEVEACKALRGAVDVFLSHEAPKPFRAFPGGRGPDAGKAQINEVLAAMRPRLHLFGHHHRFSDEQREGVRSVGLDLVTRSYLLVDAATLDIRLEQMR